MSKDEGYADENDGGGWGWGWISAAADMARTAYESNVKPAINSVEASTNEFVLSLAKAIDVESNENLPPSPSPLENRSVESPSAEKQPQEIQPGSSYPPATPPPSEPQEIPEDDSLYADTLNSFAYFGQLAKKIGSQIGDVEAMERTVKQGGATLASALNTAYVFITDDEADTVEGELQQQRERQIRMQQQLRNSSTSSNPNPTSSTNSDETHTPSKIQRPTTPQNSTTNVPGTPISFPSTPSSDKLQQTSATIKSSSSSPFNNSPSAAQPNSASPPPTAGPPTFFSLFESKLGLIHMATLENLSSQSTLQMQRYIRKMSPEVKSQVEEKLHVLKLIFDPNFEASQLSVSDESQDSSLSASKKKLFDIFSNAEVDMNSKLPSKLFSETSVASNESLAAGVAKFDTHFEALRQRLEFYQNRTKSLQGFATKAIEELHGNGQVLELKNLAEAVLNYRGKMHLEVLRQIAEFCALSVYQILNCVEILGGQMENLQPSKNQATSVVDSFEPLFLEAVTFVYKIAVVLKRQLIVISAELVSSMNQLLNNFKTKVIDSNFDQSDPLVQTTVKRITTGINNVQLDTGNATGQVMQAARLFSGMAQSAFCKVVSEIG